MNLSVVNLTDVLCERKSQTKKKSVVLFLYNWKVAELFCTVTSQNPTCLEWQGLERASEAFAVAF